MRRAASVCQPLAVILGPRGARILRSLSMRLAAVMGAPSVAGDIKRGARPPSRGGPSMAADGYGTAWLRRCHQHRLSDRQFEPDWAVVGSGELIADVGEALELEVDRMAARRVFVAAHGGLFRPCLAAAVLALEADAA